MTRPAIVISPGGFCTPALYEDVANVLRSSGYEVHVVAHRSIGTPFSPLPTMYDDAAQIHALLASLADQGKEVVLVMHSYGGMPGTESVKGVSLTERRAQGKPGGVSQLLYVACIIAQVGMKAQGADGGAAWLGHVEHGWVTVSKPLMAQLGWSDVPLDQAEAYAKELSPMSPVALETPLTWPGYKHIPCSWFLTEADQAVPSSLQKEFIKLLEAARGETIDVHLSPSGHFPANSNPQALAKYIEEVAGEKQQVVS